jgi:hypothetical protein
MENKSGAVGYKRRKCGKSDKRRKKDIKET